MAVAGNIEGLTDGNATVDNLEMYLKSLDPGLCRFKEEFIKFSVSSKATMKFLRPREVRTINIPDVYKRMIISEIIHLQSPSSRTKLKNEEADSPAQGQGEQGRRKNNVLLVSPACKQNLFEMGTASTESTAKDDVSENLPSLVSVVIKLDLLKKKKRHFTRNNFACKQF